MSAGARIWTTSERLVQSALVLAIGAACLIVLQKSFHFVGSTPFLNVDDSIPNVAVNLAEHGRYGFLSSPAQAYNDADRTHAFFNYGPLYFWWAAALAWLIGPSLTLFRMLHPIGLVCIVLLATWTFRRTSLAGAAIFAIVIFDLYLNGHWPIARPDIMVSLCAALFLVSAAAAIEQRTARPWFAAGFFAMSVATSHQIASVVVPAAALIWLWSVAAERRNGPTEPNPVVSLAALVMGGASGLLAYLFAIDFRVKDVWSLIRAGSQANSRPFLEMLQTHFYYAWSTLDQQRFRLVLAGFCVALGMTAASAFLPEARRRMVLSLVMPSVVLAILYPLSLGFYGSSHTGYVILCQVAAIWAVAGSVSVAIAWGASRPWGRMVALTAAVLAIVAVVRADARWLTTSALWEQRAPGNVAMGDYIHQVLSRFPERARVWGSLYFGMDAGDRTDLLQYNQIFQVVQADFRPEFIPSLAPDFLALGSYDLDQAAVLTVADVDYSFERLVQVFPQFRYRPVRLVLAPPYGGAMDFERVSRDTPEDRDLPPEVAVNDGTGRQWRSSLNDPMDVKFAQVQPVSVDISVYSFRPRRPAEASIVADLPAGAYLIELALQVVGDGHVGFVMATSGTHFYWRSGWTDFPVPATFYFPGARRTWVLVDHLGGPLYLSRFEKGAPRASGKKPEAYAMQVVSVRQASALASNRPGLQAVSVPAWNEWTRIDPKARLDTASQENTVTRLSGAFQPNAPILESPPITVPAHQRVALIMPSEVARGALKVGVVAVGGPLLASPTLMPRRVVFETGRHTEVVITVVNSELDEPLDVRLRNATLTPLIPQEQYVDVLMRCRSPYIKLDKSDCVR